MRKYRQTLRQTLGLESRWERNWFYAGFILLLVYLELVVLGQNFLAGRLSWLALAGSAAAAALLCPAAVLLCAKFRLPPSRTGRRRGPLVFAAVFLLTLALLFTWQRAFWPGAFSVDSFDQYAQVLEGSYNNWHPVLHTWLFFTLPMALVGQPWAIVFFQLLLFSAALAYLFYVLYTEGCPWGFLLPAGLYILLNPYTDAILLYPWKDCAMDIFLLLLFGYLVRLYSTEGLWLKRPAHLILFSLTAFLALSMRHNAVLLIGPLFLVLLVFLKRARKSLLISGAAVLAAALFWMGPGLTLAGVERPDKRVTETMGLPMSALCSIYDQVPESMSEEVRDFMASLAEPYQWELYYFADDGFNTIKWHGNPDLSERIDEKGAAAILRYTLDSALRAPRPALGGILRLTDFVWKIGGGSLPWSPPVMQRNEYGIQMTGDQGLQDLALSYTDFTGASPLKYLFNLIGTVILFLLFLAVAQLGRGNLGRVFLVIPVMAYNFGTMLLLSGPDYRFFHFNFLLVVPLLYLILQGKAQKPAPAIPDA